jgi:hypothetical protein
VLAEGTLSDGTLAGQRVAVKGRAGSDPFWAAKLRHEALVCQAFAAAPPPVRVPELVCTDGSRLLILEWLDGRPLDDDRYPQRTLGGEEIGAVLRCVLALSQWVAPPGALDAVFDLARLHRQLGADTPAVKARIEETITDAGCTDAFAVNLAAVVVRELRIHHDLPAGRLRDARLRLIDRAWQHARDRLHRLAAGG